MCFSPLFSFYTILVNFFPSVSLLILIPALRGLSHETTIRKKVPISDFRPTRNSG